MWDRILGSRWSYVAIAIAMIAIYLAVNLEFVSDPHPLGGVDDIERLAERDDLNVLFILVDTLRAHRLSSYGYERETSPHIDALAETGVRFARQVSQSSWTKCSMASLWSGVYPARTGVLRYGHAVTDSATMPAEIFREAGYRTAGIWRNGWVSPNFGFGQGFEIYHRPRPAPLPATVRNENPNIKLQGSDADIVRSATEFLRTHGHERWFLYLHLMDVHQYVSDEESARFGTTYSDIYDNAIHWTDRMVRLLLNELERRKLREKTLVVFVSDHGEGFGEHGREGHARDVYAEVTDVPFVLSFPFRLEPGLIVEERTANVDVWPTVLDLVGLPIPEGLDGRSLVPSMTSGGRVAPDNSERLIFAQIDQNWGRVRQRPNPLVAVIEGRYRLIHHAQDPSADELFDREHDALEQRDLIEEQPEIAARLRERVADHLAAASPPWGDEAPLIELDELELNQLRALGYAIE